MLQQQITPNQMPQPMVVKQEYPKPDYSYGNMDQRPQDAYGVQVIWKRDSFNFGE